MNHGGKGSKSRPLSVSREEYKFNWDRIFSKKEEEPQELELKVLTTEQLSELNKRIEYQNKRLKCL